MLACALTLTAWLAQSDAASEPAHHGDHAGHAPSPTGADAFGLPATELGRNVSGTAWQPGDTPHTGWHGRAGAWQLMLHGIFFAGLDWQAGPRGGRAGMGTG